MKPQTNSTNNYENISEDVNEKCFFHGMRKTLKLTETTRRNVDFRQTLLKQSEYRHVAFCERCLRLCGNQFCSPRFKCSSDSTRVEPRILDVPGLQVPLRGVKISPEIGTTYPSCTLIPYSRRRRSRSPPLHGGRHNFFCLLKFTEGSCRPFHAY